MRTLRLLFGIGLIIMLSGCATLKDKISNDADRVTQQFFEDLQRSNRQAAFNLFGKGLSQTVTYDQFNQMMSTLQEHWGRIDSEETTVMPFHKRLGETNFIPLNVSEDKIKRYVFDVKFENAEVNCDLTLADYGQGYKIIWISFWGSSVYMTPEINGKIQELFEKPDDLQKDQ